MELGVDHPSVLRQTGILLDVLQQAVRRGLFDPLDAQLLAALSDREGERAQRVRKLQLLPVGRRELYVGPAPRLRGGA